ncbi:MAG: SpoIIE family protein phosphatase, partial [Methanosarcinales archaeon]|nr:SpoIIE family protein phosphatase [Methanosarcinales archaeon]
MAEIAGIRLKLSALLVAAAVLPVIIAGYVSVMELKDASSGFGGTLSDQSITTINRTSLTSATYGGTDQEDLALAKANQYNEFFKRIEFQTSFLAGALSSNLRDENCTMSITVWADPGSSNESTIREAAKSLCVPAGMLQRTLKKEPSTVKGYIGTADGALITWPDGKEASPPSQNQDPRAQPWYRGAQTDGKTVWVKGDPANEAMLSITCATPAYRESRLYGVVAMEISLSSIYADLSGLSQRGYPFILNQQGQIVMFPKVKRGDAPWDTIFLKGSFNDANSTELEALARRMIKGMSGSSLVTLQGKEWYIAYAPITSTGWSLGVAFPLDQMLLPASYLEGSLAQAANSSTGWMDQAAGRMKWALILAALLAGAIFGGAGLLMGKKIAEPLEYLTAAAHRMGGGDLEGKVKVSSSDELGELEKAMDLMRQRLKIHMEKADADAALRARGALEAEISRELMRDSQTGRIPLAEGLDISARSSSSDTDYAFRDIVELEDGRIAMAVGEVSGTGFPAAILSLTTRTLIRAFSDVSADPGEVLRQVNRRLGDRPRGMPVSCLYGVLDPESQSFESANAGHAPPFVIDYDGMVETLSGGGISLGGMDSIVLETESRDL